MRKARRPDDFVSLWAWVGEMPADPEPVDTLKDLCGVDSYDVDFQEAVGEDDSSLRPIAELIGRLSYADMFLQEAVAAAHAKGLTTSPWVMAQFRFVYDPRQATRPVADNPVFLGAFRSR